MSDTTHASDLDRPGSPAPPARNHASGWVKLGTGLAVIAAQITESVLHPAVAEILMIADVAIPLIVGLILLTAIVWGSNQTCERIFRLLRWITNRPEPAAPAPSLSPRSRHLPPRAR